MSTSFAPPPGRGAGGCLGAAIGAAPPSFARRLAAARGAVAPAVPAAYFFFAREGGFEIHAIVDPAAPVKLTDIHKYKNQGLITYFARPHQIRRR